MWHRWTDRARRVMQIANQEAQRFNHEYVGTEHILLGLMKDDSGVGQSVLKNSGLDLRGVRLEVEKRIPAGPDMVTMGKLPQTPRAKKVIEYAMEEARNLNHNYVGTEHIVLGLFREQGGVAYEVLTEAYNLTYDALRAQTLNALSGNLEEVVEGAHPLKLRKPVSWDVPASESNLRQVLRMNGYDVHETQGSNTEPVGVFPFEVRSGQNVIACARVNGGENSAHYNINVTYQEGRLDANSAKKAYELSQRLSEMGIEHNPDDEGRMKVSERLRQDANSRVELADYLDGK